MWSNPVINFVWILMVPVIIVYLAVSYWQGTKKIAKQMDEDEEEFEQDLVATYASEEDVMEAYEEVAEQYKETFKELAEEGDNERK